MLPYLEGADPATNTIRALPDEEADATDCGPRSELVPAFGLDVVVSDDADEEEETESRVDDCARARTAGERKAFRWLIEMATSYVALCNREKDSTNGRIQRKTRTHMAPGTYTVDRSKIENNVFDFLLVVK